MGGSTVVCPTLIHFNNLEKDSKLKELEKMGKERWDLEIAKDIEILGR